MNPDILGWVGAALLIVGVSDIAKHRKSGFLYCIIGDALFGIQGTILHMTSLIALNLVLLYLHAKGFYNWAKMGI